MPKPRDIEPRDRDFEHDDRRSRASDKQDAPKPVLVVEDDEGVRFLLTLALAEAGLQTVETGDGRRALELIRGGDFGAVLLDNRLPGITGLEIIEIVRAEDDTRTLPIILVTGDDEVADRVRGLGMGANDYVIKPFDVSEVVARVKAHLRGQEAWMHVVERHIQERGAVATAMNRLVPGSTPEATAGVFCAELRLIQDLAGIALVEFASDGSAVPLALDPQIPTMDVGRPLPASLARYLKLRAEMGPWIERREPDGTISAESLLGWGTLACAPMIADGAAIGLFVLRVDPPGGEASATAASRALSAAIDYAAMATGLLRGPLAERARRQGRRSQMEEILAGRLFSPVFQPVVRLTDLEIVGYEALTRFTDGTEPDLRFSEAARLGLGVDLELTTLAAALDASKALPGDSWLSVNVSPQLVVESPALGDLLRRSERPLVLELTEHDRVDDYRALRSALDELGPDVKVSVDDAGSGFASLAHVLALEPEYMKLDQAWVMGVQGDPTRQALIAGLSHFANATGCLLIAEGIETEPELIALRELDAELGQGFLFGHPEPAMAGGIDLR